MAEEKNNVTAERLIEWQGKHAFEGPAKLTGAIDGFHTKMTMRERQVAAEKAYARAVLGDGYYFSCEFESFQPVWYVIKEGTDIFFRAEGKKRPLYKQAIPVQREWYEKFGAGFAVGKHI